MNAKEMPLHKTIFLMFAFCAAAASQGQVFPLSGYFPLLTGNQWEYREASTGAPLRISVGETAEFEGNLYHRLTGYTGAPLWVRYRGPELVYWDADGKRDLVLTPLARSVAAAGGWTGAARPCEGLAQVDPEPAVYQGPLGVYRSALRVRFDDSRCVASTLEENFVDSIGMVSRQVAASAGPRIFHLVRAKVGAITIDTDPGAAFHVSVQEIDTPAVSFAVTLRASLRASSPLHTRKPSGQDFDVVLKTEDGRRLWQWSEGKAFPPGIEQKQFAGLLEYRVEIPARPDGQVLPPGRYVIEAWLTLGDDRIQYSAATPAAFRTYPLRAPYKAK